MTDLFVHTETVAIAAGASRAFSIDADRAGRPIAAITVDALDSTGAEVPRRHLRLRIKAHRGGQAYVWPRTSPASLEGAPAQAVCGDGRQMSALSDAFGDLTTDAQGSILVEVFVSSQAGAAVAELSIAAMLGAHG